MKLADQLNTITDLTEKYYTVMNYMELLGFEFIELQNDHEKRHYRIMTNGSSVFVFDSFYRLHLCENDKNVLETHPEYKSVPNYKNVSAKIVDKKRPYRYDLSDSKLFVDALHILASESGDNSQLLAEQREWILPCNINIYDVSNALRDLKRIDWRQTKQLNNAHVGDIVYIYCKDKKPGEIRYKGAILAVNKTDNLIDDSKYILDGSVTSGPCVEIAVFREYELTDELRYSDLKKHGLLSTLQGPTVIKGEVAEYLHECDDIQRTVDRHVGELPDTCLFPFPININEIRNDRKNGLAPLDDSHTDEEKERHAQSLSLDDLREIARSQSTKNPKQITTTTTQISRNVYIAEYAKKRANGICQLCGNPAPFNRPDGEPYLESHHIVWLSRGGSDSIGNTVALCPNCHTKMHIVDDPNDVNKLVQNNSRIISNV